MKMGIETLRKFRLLSVVGLSSFLLWACSIQPVEKNELNIEGGFADFEGIRIKVGEMAPDFVLPDENEKLIRLSSFREKKHVMLVVYRGEWCPYCMSQLDSFESLLPLLGKYGIQLIGVSPDPLDKMENAAKKFSNEYIFVSDESMTMIDEYGLRKDSKIPHPATILINERGEVVWYFASSNYKVRPDASQMRMIIGKHLRSELHLISSP